MGGFTVHTLKLLGRRASRYAFIVLDYIGLLAALRLAEWVRNILFVPRGWAETVTRWNDTWAYFVIPAVYLAFFLSERMYEPHRFLWKRMQSLARACFFATLVLSALNYFVSGERQFSRVLMLLTAVFSFGLLFTLRYAMKRLLGMLGLWQVPVLVVTAHRRENLGAPIRRIATAVRQVAEKRPDLRVVWPVHPNPQVHRDVHAVLGTTPNVILTDPLDFIAQEMFREANTIASKTTDSSVSHLSVEIKNNIEKIREQCRNVV